MLRIFDSLHKRVTPSTQHNDGWVEPDATGLAKNPKKLEAVRDRCFNFETFMKNILYIALPAALTLSACVKPEQTSAIGPSGNKMLVSKCSQSPNGCYQKATETCSGSYQVLDSYSKAGGLVADIIPGPVTWYYMTYQCGPSDGRTPTFPFRGQQYTPPPIINVPAPTYRGPSTTTCNRLGDTVTCNSY